MHPLSEKQTTPKPSLITFMLPKHFFLQPRAAAYLG